MFVHPLTSLEDNTIIQGQYNKAHGIYKVYSIRALWKLYVEPRYGKEALFIWKEVPELYKKKLTSKTMRIPLMGTLHECSWETHCTGDSSISCRISVRDFT